MAIRNTDERSYLSKRGEFANWMTIEGTRARVTIWKNDLFCRQKAYSILLNMLKISLNIELGHHDLGASEPNVPEHSEEPHCVVERQEGYDDGSWDDIVEAASDVFCTVLSVI